MTTPDSKIELGWRLRIRMAEAGIPSATELARRLSKVGYAITSAQLSRIVDERPSQIKTALLEALLEVLGGGLDDLMPIQRHESPADALLVTSSVAGSSAVTKAKRKRASASANHDMAEDQVGGPKVAAFPVPAKR